MRRAHFAATLFIAFCMMLMARPATADVIFHYRIDPSQSYPITGTFAFDRTLDQIVDYDVGLQTPTGYVPGDLLLWYVCCGSHGDSLLLLRLSEAVVNIPDPAAYYPLPPTYPAIYGLNFETGYRIDALSPWGSEYGIQSGEYCFSPDLFGSCGADIYGASLTLVRVTGRDPVPEPSSVLLFVSGLALLLLGFKMHPFGWRPHLATK